MVFGPVFCISLYSCEDHTDLLVQRKRAALSLFYALNGLIGFKVQFKKFLIPLLRVRLRHNICQKTLFECEDCFVQMKDPYLVLGVSKSATDQEIKSAYRKLAKELHPDLNPNDSIVEQRFKEVSAAYNLLSDKTKRAQFDRGEINADGSQRADYGFGGFRGGFDGGDDIFSDLFGRGRGGGRTVRMKGKDVNYTVSVDFLEAALGAKRRINLYDGASIDINIPAGTTDGQTLRLKGKGMAGMGGAESGDAFVEIHVAEHEYYERDGKDIFVDLPITLSEAVLGGKVNIPTIHGQVSMKIPAGSNTGANLRLRGKGVIPKTGAAGDQYVKLKVVLPNVIDDELKAFLTQWDKKNSYDVRGKMTS